MARLTDAAHNERVKLTANLLNTIASGMLITGVVAPVVAASYGVPGPAQACLRVVTVISAIWFMAGIALHLTARIAEEVAMTWFEIYAYFGAPLVAVLIGFGLYWWTGRSDSR